MYHLHVMAMCHSTQQLLQRAEFFFSAVLLCEPLAECNAVDPLLNYAKPYWGYSLDAHHAHNARMMKTHGDVKFFAQEVDIKPIVGKLGLEPLEQPSLAKSLAACQHVERAGCVNGSDILNLPFHKCGMFIGLKRVEWSLGS